MSPQVLLLEISKLNNLSHENWSMWFMEISDNKQKNRLLEAALPQGKAVA
jgi:hypothetical protein